MTRPTLPIVDCDVCAQPFHTVSRGWQVCPACEEAERERQESEPDPNRAWYDTRAELD